MTRLPTQATKETKETLDAMRQRALMPDYLRLLALFGIVTVNVQFMAFPIDRGFVGATEQSMVDDTAAWLVNGLAYLKTYGLFSFMFGVGLAFQMGSAERRGLPFGALYRNRMIGLFILGVAHGCLLFPGDILATYALTGSVLYLWRGWSVKRLVRMSIILLIAQLVLASTIIALLPEAPSDMAALERTIMTEGTLMDVIALRSITFAFLLPLLILIQGFSALGWFCLGLAAVKSGLIDRADHPLWAKARRLALAPGVLLSLAAAAIMQWYDRTLGEILVVIAAPLATIGYLGVIAALAKPPSPLMTKLLAAGGSSLTIYLGQSILLSTLFAPYGLDLWDAVSPTMALILAVAATLALIGFVLVWRSWFAQGPFEALLRAFTRLGAKARP